ncbi:hypothetical protein GGS23DRAFT_27578 [Durotheca rogersii]|uniref:uncharacterized protein n=1 Tax=Durotheca rogersii TaxID=419775 RepID=UPI00221F5BA7|nr:uncharacterized protein GGS23DRAFT_27578 [Durotheca rogersii]KAI5868391.1 hypothetical protein GGS23DRAFT_27578 [Durotheca rogersii]
MPDKEESTHLENTLLIRLHAILAARAWLDRTGTAGYGFIRLITSCFSTGFSIFPRLGPTRPGQVGLATGVQGGPDPGMEYWSGIRLEKSQIGGHASYGIIPTTSNTLEFFNRHCVEDGFRRLARIPPPPADPFRVWREYSCLYLSTVSVPCVCCTLIWLKWLLVWRKSGAVLHL